MSRDLGQELAHLLEAVNFVNFGGTAMAEILGTTGWASITFSGARHRLRISLAGAGAVGAAADFLADMNEAELPLRGHIVADLALIAEARSDDGRSAWLEVEVLTIEDS